MSDLYMYQERVLLYRTLLSFFPLPTTQSPPARVNVTELRTGHRVQPASATTHQSASGFRDA
ncbi:uncharacterized protein METZ01_LOCUS430190, partial [marine metagenome]